MKMYVLAVLMLAAFNASATNNNPPSNGGDNEANSHANGGAGGSGTGVGVGVGLGVGIGGEGGKGGSGGQGGDGGTAIAAGGHGGSVAGSGNSANLNSAKGGNASQGQSQGQGQHQSSKSIAQQALENSNKINASSANDNRSNASGNTTATTVNVGGDSTLVERNAPPVFLGNLTATMSCAGGFNAGASDRNGSGAFGLTWISSDCRSVVMGREFVGIGMPDVACRIWKTTKGYKRAVKADPSLANVDCTAKPEPAAVVVPVAPELAPRIPRG